MLPPEEKKSGNSAKHAMFSFDQAVYQNTIFVFKSISNQQYVAVTRIGDDAFIARTSGFEDAVYKGQVIDDEPLRFSLPGLFESQFRNLVVVGHPYVNPKN